MTRDEFMEFFRDEDKLNTLSVDDRIEVFETVLTGSTDITKERLNSVINDYCVEGLIVIDTDKHNPLFYIAQRYNLGENDLDDQDLVFSGNELSNLVNDYLNE